MKRIITGTFVVLVIIAAFLAAVPFLVSSETVRNGITAKIEKLTGRNVSFKGDPSLSFSPFLGFEISDLELIDPLRPQEAIPLLKVEKVKAQINLLPALIGNVEITEYQFLRPRFFFKTYSDGSENWSFEKGAFDNALKIASNNRTNQTDTTIPTIAIGNLVIKDGIFVYEDAIAGTSKTITSLNGKISWHDTQSELDISGNGIWQGEGITVNAIIEEPIKILSGGESRTFVELNSHPLSFTFDGLANMFASLFVKGDLNAQSPSISRLLEVFEIDLGGLSNSEDWNVSGILEATANSTNLSDATFVIGENTATGVIRLSKNELEKLKLDGTLAFEELDLVNSFNSLGFTNTSKTQPQLIKDLNIDLRVSSQTINVGTITLDNVAAALIADNEGWTFDIGDASAFNGKLVAKLGKRLANNKQQVFVDISASDMNSESISNLVGSKLISITGKTSFTTSLRTSKLNDGVLSSGLNGTFTGDFNSGTLAGINLLEILAAQNQQTAEQIAEFVPQATTPFQTMKVKLFLNNGIAAVSKSTLVTDEKTVQAIGDINFNEGKLNLQLQELTQEGPRAERFLLQGTFLEPTITLKADSPSINQN